MSSSCYIVPTELGIVWAQSNPITDEYPQFVFCFMCILEIPLTLLFLLGKSSQRTPSLTSRVTLPTRRCAEQAAHHHLECQMCLVILHLCWCIFRGRPHCYLYVVHSLCHCWLIFFHLCLPFLCAKISPGISSTKSAPSNLHLKFEGQLLSHFTREHAAGSMTLPDISGLLTFSHSQSPTANLAREKLSLLEAPPFPTSPSPTSPSTISVSTLMQLVTSKVLLLMSLKCLEHET